MKKKRLILLPGILFSNILLLTASLHAQVEAPKPRPSIPEFYVKASAGYGLGIDGDYFMESNNGYVTNTLSQLGNALNYNVSGGCQFNKNIGAELGISYENGLKTNEAPPADGNSNTLTGNMWQIIPSVVFSTSIGKFTYYIRTGMVIGSPEVLLDHMNNFTIGSNTSNYEDTKIKYYKGIATGFQTAVGFNIPLKNQKWIVFAEASFNDIGFLPQKGTVYSETVNGVDQLPTLNTSEKEEVFTKSYSYNPFAVNSTSKPSSAPETKLLFGSLAYNLGVKMAIGSGRIPTKEEHFHQHYFARINAGYGVSADGDINYNESKAIYKAINVSYGNGFNSAIGVEYMVNESLGFDLGLNYVASTTIKPDAGGTLVQNIYQYGDQSSEYGNMIQLNPSLVVATHIHKLLPYARLGALIGSGNVYYTYEDNNAFLNGSHYDRQTTIRYYGGISFGYNVVLGTAFWLGYKYDLITEVSFNNIYEIPEKGQVIKDNYNGTSNLGNESTSDKEIVFKSSYNENSNPDPNSPTVASPVKFSFDAVVFRVGMRRWF